MANIDPQSFFASFLPDVSVTKIVLEKNNGFFKRISDPHIENAQEREANLAETESFKMIVDIESRAKKIVKQKSFFTDQKTINEGMKIGVCIFQQIPEKGFQQGFEQEISNSTRSTRNVYLPVEKNFFSINTFESQSERSVNNINFLVKKYSRQLFEYPTEPQSLYIVYGAYVELPDEYVNRFGFQGRIFAPVKVETIFEDGKTKSKSSLFFIQNTDDIWAGEVSFNQQQNSYQTVETTARLLEEYSIPNYRLQDLRIQSKIEKQEIEFKKFNEELLNNKLKQKVSTNNQNKIYFSDIFLSNRDSSNFFFSINLRQLILDNCMLSKIYQELPEYLTNSIIETTKIISLKILRRRVMRSGLSTNPLTDERISFKMMPGEKEEVILACKSDNINSFLNVVTDKCELKQIKSCFSDTNSFSSFFVKDFDLINKSEGEYQYGIEIELSDPSRQIISQDLDGLRFSLKHLTNTLNNINKIKNFLTDNQINNFEKQIYWDDPHIADSLREIIFKTTTNPNVSSIEQRNIDAAIKRYFVIFSKYFTGISESRQQQLEEIIKSQVSYFVEETEGLENFINLYNRLITNLEELADNKIFIFDDPHVEGISGNVRNSSKNLYKITNYFSNDFADANYLDFKNVDYINKKGTGFNELTTTEFINLLLILKKNDRFTQDNKILPFSIYYSTAKLDIEGVRELYDSFSYDYKNMLNQELVKHVNLTLEYETPQIPQDISISSYPQLENDIYNIEQDSLFNVIRQNEENNQGSTKLTQQERERAAATKQNNRSIKQFYNFVYKSVVANKNIDNVIELYQEGQLDEFYVKFQYLRNFNFSSKTQTKSGVWEDSAILRQTPVIDNPIFNFDQNTYLFCRFNPIKNSYKNNNWNISEEMNFTDVLFIVKVESSGNMKDIQTALDLSSATLIEEIQLPAILLKPEENVRLPTSNVPEIEFTFNPPRPEVQTSRVSPLTQQTQQLVKRDPGNRNKIR